MENTEEYVREIAGGLGMSNTESELQVEEER